MNSQELEQFAVPAALEDMMADDRNALKAKLHSIDTAVDLTDNQDNIENYEKLRNFILAYLEMKSSE